MNSERRLFLKNAGLSLAALAGALAGVNGITAGYASAEHSENLHENNRDKGSCMSEEKFIGPGNVRINYLDAGRRSGTPVILLHGGAWNWLEFTSLIPALSESCHVFALDLRGNGKSGWTPGHYRLADFTGDVTAFMKEKTGPAVLAGHSIGGVIALMAAAREPGNTKAVVVEDAPLAMSTYRSVVNSSREMFATWLRLKKSSRSREELSLALAGEYANYPGITSQWLTYFAECLHQLDPTFFNPLLHDFEGFAQGYDYRQILGKITCPLLFIRGEVKSGAVMSDEEARWVRSTCANATCVDIEGVGHLLHLQERGAPEVSRVIADFLARHCR